MSTDAFKLCLRFCLLKETGGDLINGGYTEDQDDPGGATKFGISKKSYPYIDIPSLTMGQAESIYRKDFWEPIKGDLLPLPVAFVLFEQSVNQRYSCFGARKNLQAALGVKVDGVFGQKTLMAIKAIDHDDIPSLVLNLCKERVGLYLSLNNAVEEKYEKGWVNRLLEVQNLALSYYYKPEEIPWPVN